jgi:hypothetical protein
MHYVTSSHTWYDVRKYTRYLQGMFTKKVDFLKTINLVILARTPSNEDIMLKKIFLPDIFT